MRALFVIAAAVIAISLGIGAQERPPNTAPTSYTKGGGGVGELQGSKKTDKTKQTGPDEPQIVPCTKAAPCYVVEEPQAKSEEQKAQDASLDRLYRRYMWATIIGVGGAFIGLGLIFWQTRIAGRSANAAKASAEAALLNAQAVIKSERAWVDGMLRRPPSMPAIDRLEVVITNHGKTPAHVHSYEIAHGLFEKQVVPDALNKTIWPANFLLGSGAERRVGDLINMDSIFPRGDGTQTGAYCVWINYSDLVSDKNDAGSKHRTFFLYYYRPLLKSIERIPVDDYS